ncbi:phosphatase PAP2 family protein [Tateyamaria sp. ANG-S1]|uniref:phosphatase PAP2 family protein n=1 Tax=Tateyamaria sp. ANG-S1 TaxID=1577905 RepID=UPI0006916BBA|nr:phosphatase PAP2 family protein [Tateyamaria sp. ANG-S1]
MRPFEILSLRQSLWAAALVLLVGATLYPSDMDGHYAQSKNGEDSRVVTSVEAYGRHINTLIPIGTALVLRDIKGLAQIGAVLFAGTAATHIPKRLLNDVEINGTRLGQRPNGGQHNMPSGHSALASAGAWIAVRRYLKLFGVIVWPVLFLTMYARYMLDAHTVSATIAGAIIGILVADLFMRPCFRLRRILATRPSTLRRRNEFAGKAPVSA